MDNHSFDRLELLVGGDNMQRFKDTRVIVFGVGGVGSWTVESLARTGIGHITIVDCDRVDVTNINRQMPALTENIGRIKTDVVKDRILAINPSCEVEAIREYYTESTAGRFTLDNYDYVIDAIDTLSDKALLILNATRSSARLFSSMGAALKMDPSKIAVTEFWKINGCPLAASLRRRFKKSGVFPARKFKAVYSPEIFRNRGEQPVITRSSSRPDELDNIDLNSKKAQINGTVSHTTAIFGFTLAGLVVQDIISKTSE